MTKPAITKRSVKGAALTYSELDTNFENLKDATITLTAGTGGTSVVADLNGTITLVAGTGVTLTGDNTAKTITIDATVGGIPDSGLFIDAGSGDYELAADIDLNGYRILSNGTNIQVGDDVSFPAGTGPYAPDGQLRVRGTEIKLEYTGDPGLNISNGITGTPTSTSAPSTYLKVQVNGNIRWIPLYT
jgi:hypothetical protein